VRLAVSCVVALVTLVTLVPLSTARTPSLNAAATVLAQARTDQDTAKRRARERQLAGLSNRQFTTRNF
jgi:hypothetical protein